MYNCEKYHDIIMVLSWLSCYYGNHHDFHGIMGFIFVSMQVVLSFIIKVANVFMYNPHADLYSGQNPETSCCEMYPISFVNDIISNIFKGKKTHESF